MADTGLGGRAGKARQKHHFERFAQREAEEAIEDFLAVHDSSTGSERIIPVRRRAEFIPTAVDECDDSAAGPGFEQLGFDFDPDLEPARNPEADREYARWAARAAAAVADPSTTEQPDRPAAEPIVFRPQVAQPATAVGRQPASPAQPFSLRGLLTGCAIGAAAAAVLLLVIRVLVL